MPDPSPLPEPVVSPDVYDEAYFRTCCAGAHAWSASGGAAPDGMYEGYLLRARLAPGEVLVDLGCGRGELIAVAARRGAARAVGVEYAEAAVELARQTLVALDAGSAAEVLQADVRAVPLPDGCADLVTMLDVVEHLAPAELDAALREARRLLREGGRLLVHTTPNRSVYDVVYRWQRALRPSRRRSWPADPRGPEERLMHVNEQTPRSLRRALVSAGFPSPRVAVGQWVHTGHLPDASAGRWYARAARVRGLRDLVAYDVWGEAVR